MPDDRDRVPPEWRDQPAIARFLDWVNRPLAGRALVPETDRAIPPDSAASENVVTRTADITEKARFAHGVESFDPLGIDCIAASVNELVATGARPSSVVYRIGAREPAVQAFELIGRGLYEAARHVGVTLPAGSIERTDGDHDLTIEGTAVGNLKTDQPISGRECAPGDVLVGLRSAGIHVAGVDRAVRALIEHANLHPRQTLPHFRGTIADEILRPTRPYAPAIVDALDRGIPLRALCHIHDGGWLRLREVEAPVGFDVGYLPDPQALFQEIQAKGEVSDAEMFGTFNMGIGFAVVVSTEHVEAFLDVMAEHMLAAARLGRAVADRERKITIRPRRIVGSENGFRPQ